MKEVLPHLHIRPLLCKAAHKQVGQWQGRPIAGCALLTICCATSGYLQQHLEVHIHALAWPRLCLLLIGAGSHHSITR